MADEEQVASDLLRLLQDALRHEKVPGVVSLIRLWRHLLLKILQFLYRDVWFVAKFDVVAG